MGVILFGFSVWGVETGGGGMSEVCNYGEECISGFC